MRKRDIKLKDRKREVLLTPDIVGLLTQIHEYKGEQNLFVESQAGLLSHFIERAKIQGTEASNKIEGINMALKGILSKSKLEEREFIVSPMELQNQFADFVTQVDKSKLKV